MRTCRRAGPGGAARRRGAHRAWAEARRRFNQEVNVPASAAHRAGWQRHYFRGTSPAGFAADEHQVKLAVAPFVEEG